MTQFSGKRILITGAASGIGRLMAQTIAPLQAELVLWDVNAEVHDLCDQLQQQGFRVSSYICNLAHKREIYQVAQQVLMDCGVIDILVSNAGIVTGKSLLDTADEDIELMFSVNAMASIYLVKAFLPSMIEQKSGHIVFISSAGALCATSKLVAYSATKYAVAGLEEALRFEMKRYDHPVKTTIVYPFYMDTGMFAGVKTRFPHLLPILKPQTVVNRIIKAVLHNQTRVLIPRFIYLAIFARILPLRLFDIIVEFFGINRSMDDFRGRKS